MENKNEIVIGNCKYSVEKEGNLIKEVNVKNNNWHYYSWNENKKRLEEEIQEILENNNCYNIKFEPSGVNFTTVVSFMIDNSQFDLQHNFYFSILMTLEDLVDLATGKEVAYERIRSHVFSDIAKQFDNITKDFDVEQKTYTYLNAKMNGHNIIEIPYIYTLVEALKEYKVSLYTLGSAFKYFEINNNKKNKTDIKNEIIDILEEHNCYYVDLELNKNLLSAEFNIENSSGCGEFFYFEVHISKNMDEKKIYSLIAKEFLELSDFDEELKICDYLEAKKNGDTSIPDLGTLIKTQEEYKETLKDLYEVFLKKSK